MIFKINGKQINDISDIELNFNYDSVCDTFSFTTPFICKNNEDKRLFKPLSYANVEIWNNKNTQLFSGVVLSHRFRSNANGTDLSISGYSKTGILEDCPDVSSMVNPTTDITSTTLENMSLLKIAEKMVQPFGIGIEINDFIKDKMNEPFDQVSIAPTQGGGNSIADKLSNIATMKNIILRGKINGNLLFTSVDMTRPVKANLRINDGIVHEVQANINGQNMHSDIYISSLASLSETDDKNTGSSGVKSKVTNNLVLANRPTMLTNGIDLKIIKDIMKAALAEELKNLSWDIDCMGWGIVDEGIILTGDIITLLAPEAYLYNPTKLLVRSVKLKENKDGKSATLNCVLPETFTGEQPQNIFA